MTHSDSMLCWGHEGWERVARIVDCDPHSPRLVRGEADGLRCDEVAPEGLDCEAGVVGAPVVEVAVGQDRRGHQGSDVGQALRTPQADLAQTALSTPEKISRYI